MAIGSVCDHIFTTHISKFANCQLKQPCFDTDHLMLFSEVRLGSVCHHCRYARTRKVFPCRRLIAADISDVDILHAELAEQAEKKGFTNGWENSWISGDTWNLIDWRTDARRLGQSTLVRELGRAIRSSLNKDHKARTARVATVIEQHLTKGDIWEAFGALKGWYRDAGPRPTLPSQEAIDTTRVEYEQLYQRNPPTLPEIPIHINPFSINDTHPLEEEVV